MGLFPSRTDATSGLRGGGTASQLAGFGKDLENEALMTSYNDQLRQEQQQQQGLGTLMGQPTYGAQIGQTMSGIGSTLAQGKIAGAQARSPLFRTGFSRLSPEARV